MLSVLINAYACSPGMGSEPGMAWNWCCALAQHCELHIITEGEFRGRIEAALPLLPHGRNMHFHYNPVPDKVRRMCWNQGDWRFYRHYRRWQESTYRIARDICGRERIDILHQLNMIGFREPGYLWKLARETGKPFVWGPIGGLKQFPVAYLRGAGWKMWLFNRVKNIVNVLQLKYGRRVGKAFGTASLLVSSIPDSYDMIKRHKGMESVIIPETGCFMGGGADGRPVGGGRGLRLLWVGKFDFRKQLGIAIRTLAAVKGMAGVELVVCGSGSGAQVEHYRRLAADLGVDGSIAWLGNVGNKEVMAEMRKSDLLFFTSVSDDTSTVVLEAVSCHLPVLCFDACGFGYVITGDVGVKVPLSNPAQSVSDFAGKIEYLYAHREALAEMSRNCRRRQEELSWGNKALQMVELYGKCLEAQKERPR